MISLNLTEWLALQRFAFSKPKAVLQQLQEGTFSKSVLDLEKGKRDLECLQKGGFDIITWEESRYPKMLREIYDPPLVLLAKGKWPSWEKREWAAVVGARKIAAFSRNKIREWVPELVRQGFGIVSGLAYGVDAEAHRACITAGGVTWGVLGSGVDCLYPALHRDLAEKMTAQGGYLSEFPLGTGPLPGYFPQRNRIISGLCRMVVIVQAGLKSGSLITARFALEQGREVFVVPPSDDSVAYEGNRRLLEEGATPLGEYVPREHRPVGAPAPLLAFLKKPVSVETLVRETQKRPGELLAELTRLETEGLVKKIPGALWQSL